MADRCGLGSQAASVKGARAGHRQFALVLPLLELTTRTTITFTTLPQMMKLLILPTPPSPHSIPSASAGGSLLLDTLPLTCTSILSTRPVLVSSVAAGTAAFLVEPPSTGDGERGEGRRGSNAQEGGSVTGERVRGWAGRFDADTNRNLMRNGRRVDVHCE